LWQGFEKRNPSTEKLSSFLTDPHPKMPDMSLTRAEIADLVAYIRSLDRDFWRALPGTIGVAFQ
jgi:hypothetical protein